MGAAVPHRLLVHMLQHEALRAIVSYAAHCASSSGAARSADEHENRDLHAPKAFGDVMEVVAAMHPDIRGHQRELREEDRHRGALSSQRSAGGGHPPLQARRNNAAPGRRVRSWRGAPS